MKQKITGNPGKNCDGAKKIVFERKTVRKPYQHYKIPRYNSPTKQTPEKRAFIRKSNKYYLEAITDNIIRNKGKCLCDNCNDPISHKKGTPGSLVCHIKGAGANSLLYLVKINHFILGRGVLFGECNCKATFDDRGMKETMRLYPEFQRRMAVLSEIAQTLGKNAKR